MCVLCKGFDYEGEVFFGVFDTKVKAFKAVEDLVRASTIRHSKLGCDEMYLYRVVVNEAGEPSGPIATWNGKTGKLKEPKS